VGRDNNVGGKVDVMWKGVWGGQKGVERYRGECSVELRLERNNKSRKEGVGQSRKNKGKKATKSRVRKGGRKKQGFILGADTGSED